MISRLKEDISLIVKKLPTINNLVDYISEKIFHVLTEQEIEKNFPYIDKRGNPCRTQLNERKKIIKVYRYNKISNEDYETGYLSFKKYEKKGVIIYELIRISCAQMCYESQGFGTILINEFHKIVGNNPIFLEDGRRKEYKNNYGFYEKHGYKISPILKREINPILIRGEIDTEIVEKIRNSFFHYILN